MEVIELSKKHKLDYTKINKITIENSDDKFLKYEHIKLEIVRQILNKYKRKLLKQEIYTNYPINGRIPDILHINKQTKEATIYEIKKNIDDKYISDSNIYYDNVKYKGKVVDFELIEIDKVPNNLKEMKEYLERKVV